MLPPPDWAVLDRALDQALSLEGRQRDAFLATLAPETSEALAPLLRLALRDSTLLDHPTQSLSALRDDGPDVAGTPFAGGARVGPYRIEALIGEGGMGRVFRAHRADGAFEQTVAVKVVRSSLAPAESGVAARLRREREVMASLDHPGIARLLDGGETDDGAPYLVTEFVDGAPVTEWAHARGLGVEARVRLLAEVAHAVDHAHRRFVVHRDLKPSNVLVAERDGAARPVVLDFGIAKLLDGAEGGPTDWPITLTGSPLLTPAYAAPELFDTGAPVTTAVDVYGLGALLYELLTGHRPHGDAPSLSAPPTASPQRPSSLAALSSARPMPVRAPALRGDLDTICLKALHPDPARRYASAAALADDLLRHLDGRPVLARPDSIAYVTSRFVERHRAVVGAAVIALLALVGGLAVALVALGHERAARAEAEAAGNRAEEASALLAGLFQMADPDYDDGRAVTVLEAVEEGVRQVGAIESAPLRARLLFLLGDTYIHLGEPVTADSLLQAALALHGTDASGEEVTRVRRRLLLTRDALADPERVLALGHRIYRDHRADPDPTHALAALRALSTAYSRLGQHESSVVAARRAVDLAQTMTDRTGQLGALMRLGESLSDGGQNDAAIPYLEEALEQSIVLYGREDGRTLRGLTMLGRAYGRQGQIDQAEALLGEAIAFHGRRYGAHRVGYPLAYLGEVRLRAGRFRMAAATLDSAIVMTQTTIASDHPDIGAWRTLQAEAHIGHGAFGEAAGAAREALAIADAHVPAPSVARGRALAQLGRALQGQGDDRAARTALQQAQADLATSGAQPALRPEETAAVAAALAALPDGP